LRGRHYCELTLQQLLLLKPIFKFNVLALGRAVDIDNPKDVSDADIDVANIFERRQNKLSFTADHEANRRDLVSFQIDVLFVPEHLRL